MMMRKDNWAVWVTVRKADLPSIVKYVGTKQEGLDFRAFLLIFMAVHTIIHALGPIDKGRIRSELDKSISIRRLLDQMA